MVNIYSNQRPLYISHGYHVGNLWISHVLFCSRKASWSFANMWNQLPVRHVMNFFGEITLFGKYMVSKWLGNRLVSWFLSGISSMSSSLYGISQGIWGWCPSAKAHGLLNKDLIAKSGEHGYCTRNKNDGRKYCRYGSYPKWTETEVLSLVRNS